MKQVESRVLTAEDKKVNKEYQKELDFIRDRSKAVDKLEIQIIESMIRIRDEKLYRGIHKTFEEACRADMHIEKSEWNRRLEVFDTVQLLKTSPKGEVLINELDLNKSQILALSGNTDDVESQLKVLEQIKARGVKPTAKAIKEVADEILPPKIEETKPTKSAKPEPVAEQESKPSQFDPSTFDESMKDEKPKSDDKLKARIDDHVIQLGYDVTACLKSLEKLMNEVDDHHSHDPLTNHKSLCGHYHATHAGLTRAIDGMIQVERAWKAGQGAK